MKIVSLVQARLSSSRLPGKVLLPMGKKTVLDQVLQRALEFSDQVVVCTSTNADDDPIEAHCVKQGVVCVRGPLDDVFARFRMALEHPRVEESEFFARITADSPLLSVEIANVLTRHLGPKVDYLRADYASIPLGTGMEFVRTNAFLAIDPESLDSPEREHVTLRFYETAGRYRVVEVQAPEELARPDLRLTLDYPEDYELLTRLFGELDDPSTSDVIALLEERPSWVALNASCGQRPARSDE